MGDRGKEGAKGSTRPIWGKRSQKPRQPNQTTGHQSNDSRGRGDGAVREVTAPGGAVSESQDVGWTGTKKIKPWDNLLRKKRLRKNHQTMVKTKGKPNPSMKLLRKQKGGGVQCPRNGLLPKRAQRTQRGRGHLWKKEPKQKGGGGHHGVSWQKEGEKGNYWPRGVPGWGKKRVSKQRNIVGAWGKTGQTRFTARKPVQSYLFG